MDIQLSNNSNNECDFKAAASCHVLLREILDRLVGPSAQNRLAGEIDNIDILCRHMKRVRGLRDPKTPKKIGVFGPPKRGKSSLLNALLGENILPTGKVPKSNTVIEILSRRTEDGTPWKVVITEEDGHLNTQSPADAASVLDLTTRYGAHDQNDPTRKAAKRITISGNFPNSLVFQGEVMLLDTPGAETAFSTEGNIALEEDGKRALEILDETHIVLFIVRLDNLGARTDSIFYKKHLRQRRPLCIANFLDTWDTEEQKNIADPRRAASQAYDFPLDRTHVVSADWACKAMNSSLKRDSVLWDDSRLPKLETFIKKELDVLTPQLAIPMCIEELSKALAVLNDTPKNKVSHIFPDPLYVDILLQDLNNCDLDWAEKPITRLKELKNEWFR